MELRDNGLWWTMDSAQYQYSATGVIEQVVFLHPAAAEVATMADSWSITALRHDNLSILISIRAILVLQETILYIRGMQVWKHENFRRVIMQWK
jgi:hypothetical protein